MTGGRVLVGAGDHAAIAAAIAPGDLVLLSNRPEAQLAAVEGGAGCLVVCLASPIGDAVRYLAQKRGCTLISTPCDTYTAAYLINQSIPIRQCMVSKGLLRFQLSAPLEDAAGVMARTRHVYFPVLDDEGRYCGLISRRNVLNLQRRQLILVDHNEASQCVPGSDQADILEIIDHHRVGGLQTSGPIYVRNQPVGSTATILTDMFREKDVPIPPDMAGALCCAILSDTLMFRSPTCTERDRRAARDLAALCGEEPETLGEAMFAAGEAAENKTGRELLYQDFKVFRAGKAAFGVGQASFLSRASRDRALALLRPALAGAPDQECPMVFFMLTGIREETSWLLCAGAGAESLLASAFGPPEEPGCARLPGVLSRKKQVVPQLLDALRRQSE